MKDYQFPDPNLASLISSWGLVVEEEEEEEEEEEPIEEEQQENAAEAVVKLLLAKKDVGIRLKHLQEALKASFERRDELASEIAKIEIEVEDLVVHMMDVEDWLENEGYRNHILLEKIQKYECRFCRKSMDEIKYVQNRCRLARQDKKQISQSFEEPKEPSAKPSSTSDGFVVEESKNEDQTAATQARTRENEQLNAVRIQAVWRAYKARSAMMELKLNKISAIVRIQSKWRSVLTKTRDKQAVSKIPRHISRKRSSCVFPCSESKIPRPSQRRHNPALPVLAQPNGSTSAPLLSNKSFDTKLTTSSSPLDDENKEFEECKEQKKEDHGNKPRSELAKYLEKYHLPKRHLMSPHRQKLLDILLVDGSTEEYIQALEEEEEYNLSIRAMNGAFPLAPCPRCQDRCPTGQSSHQGSRFGSRV